MLQEAGADVCAKDRLGRSAAHIGAAHGHVALARKLAELCPFEASERDAFGHIVEEILSIREGACSAVEVCAGLPSQEFFQKYVALNRPVLIRGGASRLPAASKWADQSHLTAILGSTPLASGPIPYSGGRQSTLSDFLAANQNRKAVAGATADGPRAAPPSYVFDVAVGGRCRQLLRDAELFSAEDLRLHVAYLRLPQFGLGFQGAGAPMHTHFAAVNALFAGSKRWLLTPPRTAFWTFTPAATWADSAERAQLQDAGHILEVTQHAGDLLFVPEGWGHTTVLEEYGVGIGQEFIPLSSIAS